ncbi:MAG: hypothetical protein J7539_13290 [Niabella sp.]|nr:hypothetical protein [Niabella sp.]
MNTATDEYSDYCFLMQAAIDMEAAWLAHDSTRSIDIANSLQQRGYNEVPDSFLQTYAPVLFTSINHQLN